MNAGNRCRGGEKPVVAGLSAQARAGYRADQISSTNPLRPGVL